MPVELNHTIIASRDKEAGAQFLAEILDLTVDPPMDPFTPIRLGNGVTLDYMNRDDVTSQHYAFLVDDDLFDAARKRLLDRGVQTWADPGHTEPDQINTRWHGRGLYFEDPDGHNMEIFTRAPS